ILPAEHPRPTLPGQPSGQGSVVARDRGRSTSAPPLTGQGKGMSDMNASFSDTESKALLDASRRLLPRAIVLNTREQVLEALELGLERAKIFGRVIVNSWATNDDFRIDVTGLEIGDLEKLQRAADAGAFDDRGGSA